MQKRRIVLCIGAHLLSSISIYAGQERRMIQPLPTAIKDQPQMQPLINQNLRNAFVEFTFLGANGAIIARYAGLLSRNGLGMKLIKSPHMLPAAIVAGTTLGALGSIATKAYTHLQLGMMESIARR
jgi:hypothetical protein